MNIRKRLQYTNDALDANQLERVIIDGLIDNGMRNIPNFLKNSSSATFQSDHDIVQQQLDVIAKRLGALISKSGLAQNSALVDKLYDLVRTVNRANYSGGKADLKYQH